MPNSECGCGAGDDPNSDDTRTVVGFDREDGSGPPNRPCAGVVVFVGLAPPKRESVKGTTGAWLEGDVDEVVSEAVLNKPGAVGVNKLEPVEELELGLGVK